MKKSLLIFIFIFSIFSFSSCVNTNKKTQENKIIKEEMIQKSNLTPEEFQDAINSWKYTLIDLRTNWELKQTWIISWAVQIDFYWENFHSELRKLDKNKEYLIYCAHWNRSKSAQVLMQQDGRKAKDLDKWISEWIKLWFETEEI